MPEQRWRCTCCGHPLEGPFSPCPDPICIAHEIAREAAWKRYEDE